MLVKKKSKTVLYDLFCDISNFIFLTQFQQQKNYLIFEDTLNLALLLGKHPIEDGCEEDIMVRFLMFLLWYLYDMSTHPNTKNFGVNSSP